jgi:hypothetical protein
VSVNRWLASIGYEQHESRAKTSNSRRGIDVDHTTVAGMQAEAAALRETDRQRWKIRWKRR